MTTNKVVRAIDLGFGFTKFIKSVSDKGLPKCLSFPSVTAIGSKKTLGGGVFSERDTVTVEHGGVQYEVGADAVMAQQGFSTRVLDNRYIYSDDYHVLMKGALKMMRLDEINLLVLGAPVKTYDEARAHLKKAWEGTIVIDHETKVKVDKVMVLPQPLGGLVWYGKTSGCYDEIKPQRNLVVDPGHFTLDWLMVQNFKMDNRSNSYEGGMSSVIRAIAEQIGAGNSLSTMSAIDEHFYTNKQFMFKGKPYDLEKHMPVARAVIKRAVAAMAASVGDSGSVDNIIMLGGAAELYLPEVEEKFPDHQIMIAKGKSFSNVLGYQTVGEWNAKGH